MRTSILAFADAIEKAPRQLFSGGTSISGAIDHAMTLFAKAPFKGTRRVIDVSGDGANNRGRPAADARDEAVRAGVSINGLPILVLEPFLDQYYWTNVVGGPNAFVIAVDVLRGLRSGGVQEADHRGLGSPLGNPDCGSGRPGAALRALRYCCRDDARK